MTETTEIPTEEALVERLVTLYVEINTLDEDVKSVAAEAKEAGYDATKLKAVAKLVANQKYADWREKTEAVLELLEKIGK